MDAFFLWQRRPLSYRVERYQQHRGRPYRILFAFDPRRAAYLILGSDKTDDENWYKVNVRKANEIYSAHLREIEE